MTNKYSGNEEILKAAIIQAIKGGYMKHTVESGIGPEFTADVLIKPCSGVHGTLGFNVIFSHEFAKAFWGFEKEYAIDNNPTENWRFHLMEMVLEENPIQYLEQFLDEK